MFEIHYKLIDMSMFKHKRGNEGVLYQAPNTRSKINEEVKGELAGQESCITDTQGLRLAYESPNRIYRNGSILYIAGTKDPIDFYDDLKLPFYQTRNTKRNKDVDKLIKDNAIEIDGQKHYGITDVISHSLGSAVGQQIDNDYGNISRGIFLQSPNWSTILFFNHPLHALILFLDKHAVIAYADLFWNWNARILLCSQEGLLVRAVLHGLVK